MAVTHETTLRNEIADLVVDKLDAGTTDANGDLAFLASNDAAVATLGLSAPAFGDAASGVATANAISDDTNAAGGTIAKAELRDRDNTARVFASVGATGSGEDIELSSVDVAAGDKVTMNSLTYTACP